MLNRVVCENSHVKATSQNLDHTRAYIATANNTKGFSTQTRPNKASSVIPPTRIRCNMRVTDSSHDIQQRRNRTFCDRVTLNPRGDGRH